MYSIFNRKQANILTFVYAAVFLFMLNYSLLLSQHNSPIPPLNNCYAQSYEEIRDKFGTMKIDGSRKRDLSFWNPRIKKYSLRHYGEDTYILNPKVIVLHYTALPDFPWLLVNTKSAMGEEPGLASHYVIDENTVWRILPDNIRSRGCWGINHRAINIEMCALNASDLSKKKKTMKSCARLVKHLMNKYNIPLNKVYSHETVSRMDRSLTPEVKDLVNGTPYDKYDPGEVNMKYIKKSIREIQ